MAKAFYDKEIHLMDMRTETDAEGGVKTTGYSVGKAFKGNVNFSNCEKIQEDYGLDYKVNITITTNDNAVKLADILAYDGVLYEVKGIYRRDSHNVILGAIWRV
ncbi:MAG: hypothetical protein IKW46_07515 [Bacteroidaceae bacterium]|nr:hypothetical protein [Bacteroidaceae bacterium]